MWALIYGANQSWAERDLSLKCLAGAAIAAGINSEYRVLGFKGLKKKMKTRSKIKQEEQTLKHLEHLAKPSKKPPKYPLIKSYLCPVNSVLQVSTGKREIS